MRQQLLKGMVICTLSVLTTGCCLSLGLWQNNSPMIIVQTPFHVGLEIRSPISVPTFSGLFGREHGRNYLGESVNQPNENLINDYNIVKDSEVNRGNYVKNRYDNNDLTEKNHDINQYATTTEKTKNNSNINSSHTTEMFETTTFTTEIYSTEDYETTTSDGILSRSGVSPDLVASLLG